MKWIALLRGINVSGKNIIPMVELRTLCEGLGWQNVQSYIQSGNLVFEADTVASELEHQLEAAIEKRFRFTVPVIVRSDKQWQSYIAANPFQKEIENNAKFVHLLLAKSPPPASVAETLTDFAANGEQVRLVGNGLWIYYAGGVGRSKITPAKLDKAAGSPVTARNWNTVVKLGEMLENI